MTVTKEQAGSLRDALLLESLHLVEEQAKCRVNIERLVSSGQLSLAQTRFQQNSMAISIAQIPTENSAEFNALCRIKDKENKDSFAGTEATLEKHAVDKNEGYPEPMHWFSRLPSMSLRNAAEQFKKCMDYVVESANLQRELTAVLENIQKLNAYMTQKYVVDDVER